MSTTPKTDAFFKSIQNKPDRVIMSDLLLWSYRMEEQLAAAHKALMVCDGAMMGKVNPKSVAFKMVNAILRPENSELSPPPGADNHASQQK